MENVYINLKSEIEIPYKEVYTQTIRHNEVFFGSERNVDYYGYGMTKFDYKMLYNADTVVFKRTYAVGDILMAIPVIRQMQKHYNIKNVILEYGRDCKCYALQTEMFDDILLTKKYNAKYDFYINLENGVLEQDHNLKLNKMSYPRFKIYQEYLGLPYDTDLDFHFNEDKSNMLFDETNDKCIALALTSGTKQRSLNLGFVPYLVKYINMLGYKAYIVDKDIHKNDDYNAVYASGKTNVQQAITNLKYCKAIITIDTGSLWFAHYAKIPTLVIAGSTYAQQKKLFYHPLYNDNKTACIDMRKYCKCDKDCGGKASFCHGNAPCLNEFNYGILLKDIADKLVNIL